MPLGLGPSLGLRRGPQPALGSDCAGVRLDKATEPGSRLRPDLLSETNASVPSSHRRSSTVAQVTLARGGLRQKRRISTLLAVKGTEA